MKAPRLLAVLFLAIATAGLAADDDPQIELRGIVAAGGASRFALALPGGAETAWVAVGGTFGGWTLTAYRTEDDSLILGKDGRSITIKLSSSSVGTSAGNGGSANPPSESTRATLADAEEVLNRMKFDQMIERTLKAQRESLTTMVRQLAAQSGGSAEEAQAFQAKLMETVFSGLNVEAMRNDLARAYSEVYSKEELRAIASFYGSPAGQAMAEKAPEVAARVQAAMLPRLTAATGKAQQLAKEHAAELAAPKSPAAN